MGCCPTFWGCLGKGRPFAKGSCTALSGSGTSEWARGRMRTGLKRGRGGGLAALAAAAAAGTVEIVGGEGEGLTGGRLLGGKDGRGGGAFPSGLVGYASDPRLAPAFGSRSATAARMALTCAA